MDIEREKMIIKLFHLPYYKKFFSNKIVKINICTKIILCTPSFAHTYAHLIVGPNDPSEWTTHRAPLNYTSPFFTPIRMDYTYHWIDRSVFKGVKLVGH